jgi:hypothetical protein
MTYEELLNQYRELDHSYESASLITYGKTDCGEPLQLFVIAQNHLFSPQDLHQMGKCILFINNGIHPGEPDGMDASLRLAKDLLQNERNYKWLENVVICIVPTFNIDGALRRNSTSRVNQNGPAEYGFRGNTKNLDLNRDFIKTDAQNTVSIKSILQSWNPDVFIDTHVSDGADYQYTMTLISSQHNKSNPVIGRYMNNTFTPALFRAMKDEGDEMCPYVATVNDESIPDSGIVDFLETPRFMSGYMSLYNCFAFITETHMLKPFAQRVNSTYRFLNIVVRYCADNYDQIIATRKIAFDYDAQLKVYPYNYELNMDKYEKITFKGYTAEYPISEITGLPRLKYNRSKPFFKSINHYNEYQPADSIRIPKYFYIPNGYERIVHMLEANGIRCTRTTTDSAMEVDAIYIDDLKTVSSPYEGHYLHSNVKSHRVKEKVLMKKGEFMISTQQANLRPLMETLLPDACDSYFCWGFFDSILQQKEWFADYVFEDLAVDLLKKDAALKTKFDNWKSANPKADAFSQLYFIYKNSPYFESGFKRYPISLKY